MATREEILDSIKNMSVLELSQLVKDMEEVFGVTAAAPMMMGAMPGVAAPGAGGHRGQRVDARVQMARPPPPRKRRPSSTSC